ncbi:MAG: hypothetical protein P8L37_00705 [Phycisphaerales bacterium]|nr:hypothetical protein [Phycisphaerales bacterium]
MRPEHPDVRRIANEAIEIAPEAEVETYRKSLVKYQEALPEAESPVGTP